MTTDYPPIIRLIEWPKDFPGPSFDARSLYTELVWTSRLGPTSSLAVRLASQLIETAPARGVTIPLAEFAHILGVGHRGGHHSPLVRALGRLVRFGIARRSDPDTVAVRTLLAPLPANQLAQVNDLIRAIHHRLLAEARPAPSRR